MEMHNPLVEKGPSLESSSMNSEHRSTLSEEQLLSWKVSVAHRLRMLGVCSDATHDYTLLKALEGSLQEVEFTAALEAATLIRFVADYGGRGAVDTLLSVLRADRDNFTRGYNDKYNAAIFLVKALGLVTSKESPFSSGERDQLKEDLRNLARSEKISRAFAAGIKTGLSEAFPNAIQRLLAKTEAKWGNRDQF
jgi:hypothetical protein